MSEKDVLYVYADKYVKKKGLKQMTAVKNEKMNRVTVHLDEKPIMIL